MFDGVTEAKEGSTLKHRPVVGYEERGAGGKIHGRCSDSGGAGGAQKSPDFLCREIRAGNERESWRGL